MKISPLLMTAFSLIITGSRCTDSAGDFTGRTLVVKRNETVRISELDMSITNKGCGREWMADNGGERPYCDMEVRVSDSVYFFGHSFDALVIKDLSLKIDKMNPWNVMEDSVPGGGCRIIVTRLKASSSR